MSQPENKNLFEATTLSIGEYGKWTLADVLENLNGGDIRSHEAIKSENKHEIEEFLKEARHYTVSRVFDL